MEGSYWLVAGLALLIGELALPSFFFVFFGVGAFVTGVASYLGVEDLTTQLVIFALLSSLLVLASRTIFSRYLLRKSPGADVKMNADALIGQVGTVLVPFEGELPGRVRLQGLDFTASFASPGVAGEGARVRVVKVEGIRLVVEVLDPQIQTSDAGAASDGSGGA